MGIQSNLKEMAERWRDADPGEKANAQLYLTEFAEALEVPRPQPKGSGYEFELSVRVVNRDGTESVEFTDLYREGYFLLEAKDEAAEKSSDLLLRAAYGQARSYITHLPGAPPPYILVLDVARTLIVWDRWSGTYGGFQAGHRIDLPTLHERSDDIALLRDVWLDPQARDPRAKANAVTKEIAEHLAELAASLEERGHDQESVARFLIRCVFTMFAEDVGLLKEEPFLKIVEGIGMEEPDRFSEALERLWAAMDEGDWFGAQQFLRFNGHFFRDRTALSLERDDLGVLLEAAKADWAYVEPSIFGTLLTRALDPEERHRLGAEFTPREYVERLVRPTIEEPIRQRWTRVEAEVIQLLERGRDRDKREAQRRLNEFHGWLRSLRFLDPACGSGNFLYVSLETVKRIEAEALRTLEEITGQAELGVEEVGPWQFHGIEVKPWAREIAELTLWIGYHQFWLAHHGQARPPEPVLRDTGTFECRDAVLDWCEEPPAEGGGNEAEIGPASWPDADFIVGNPPYMGKSLMNKVFGKGYVDALRTSYPDVSDGADYVMYWWHKAAVRVEAGETTRAGFITTNTIRQKINRSVVGWAAQAGVRVVWAVTDHPWVDEAGAADVTVAMTVMAKDLGEAILVEVDQDGEIMREIRTAQLNTDLSAHANVAAATDHPLIANKGLAANGFLVYGRGFILEADEAGRLLEQDPRHGEIIRPVRNGRDLTSGPRGLFVIDFGMRTETEARQYPVLYDIVRNRVKPYRDQVKDKSRRERWWQFGRTNERLRAALEGLPRYIATSYVSRHRFFTFLQAGVAAEDTIVCIALDDPYFLGVLSSRIHVVWADAAGGRRGVGNDPRYNKTRTFDCFPFPASSDRSRRTIGELAEAIEDHRQAAMNRQANFTITGLYNVIEKLRADQTLTEAEQVTYELGACGVLKDLQDELDSKVAEAFGWTWPLSDRVILGQLVGLHDERVAEERSGSVPWLRPSYQREKYGKEVESAAPTLELEEDAEEAMVEHVRLSWPDTAAKQIQAIQEAVAESPGNVEEVASRFHNARREFVARHLETLKIMGEIRQTEDGHYHAVAGPPESYAA